MNNAWSWANFSAIFKHSLFRNTSIYILSNVLKAALPFFLLPFLTQHLSPTDYGTIAIFEIVLSVLVVLVGFNTHGALFVNHYKMKEEEFGVYIGNVFLVLIVNSVLVLIGLLLFSNVLSAYLKLPEKWMIAAVFVALSNSIFLLILTIWQIEQNPRAYGLFQNLQTGLNLFLSLFLIMGLGWNWEGRLWGITISSLIFAVIGIIIIYRRKNFSLQFRKDHIKDMLYFGAPLIPHSLSGWIMTAINRIFINSMIGMREAGIYTVAYQVGIIIELLAQSFNNAYAPFLFERLKEPTEQMKIKLVRLTYVLFGVFIILAVLFIFLSPYIFELFIGKAFWEARKYVTWVTVGATATAMYFMVANYIFFVKKNHLLATATIMAAVINIALNYFLIKTTGELGAAQATAISSIIRFILVWWISMKVFSMPWGNWLPKKHEA